MNLYKTKTFWAAVAGLCTTAGMYFSGDMSAQVAVQTAIGSIIAIFMRAGIIKVEK